MYANINRASSQISNYTAKHLAKQNYNNQSKVRGHAYEKDTTKVLVNTFRKGLSKEKASTKYKTTKNSRKIL